jgi:hypothetical protein
MAQRGKQPTIGAHAITQAIPPLQVQTPPVHPLVRSASQVRPQRPQLSTLVLTFVQIPSQQASVPPQVRPHAPQFATVSRVVQRPAQHRWLAVHVAPPQRQRPATQVSPAAHAGEQVGAVQVPASQLSPIAQRRPHAPQWFVLLAVSTHPPPQHESPSPQAVPAPHRQPPSTHVSPASQAGVQVAAMHMPPTHEAPIAQRLPHSPQ